MPLLGVPHLNIAIMFGTKKLQWWDMFTCFNTMHECDRQTDGQTSHDSIGHAMHSVAWQKNNGIHNQIRSPPVYIHYADYNGSLYRRTHSLSRLAWSWVSGRLVPFYIQQMNRVNSRNGSAMMTAP